MKILIVDDNKEFAENLKDIIESEGYTVTTIYDGFEATTLIKKEMFDLILMDIRLPTMNGVEAFKKMKETVPGIKVIMMTAYAANNLIEDALNEGALAYLKKPIDFQYLLKLIHASEQNEEC